MSTRVGDRPGRQTSSAHDRCRHFLWVMCLPKLINLSHQTTDNLAHSDSTDSRSATAAAAAKRPVPVHFQRVRQRSCLRQTLRRMLVLICFWLTVFSVVEAGAPFQQAETLAWVPCTMGLAAGVLQCGNEVPAISVRQPIHSSIAHIFLVSL